MRLKEVEILKVFAILSIVLGHSFIYKAMSNFNNVISVFAQLVMFVLGLLTFLSIPAYKNRSFHIKILK